VAWLREQPVLAGCSVVTSLPDVSEIESLDLAGWKRWFEDAAVLCLEKTPDDGLTLFFQTDIKKAGEWVDKGYLVQKAAERAGARTLFHKVVCRKSPGTVTFGRPAYSHLLGFSRGLRLDLAHATADVLPEAGFMPWSRAMGVAACLSACELVKRQTATRTVVDPFCGKGTLLAVANHLGLDAVGVELSKKRARQSQGLTYEKLLAAEAHFRRGPQEAPGTDPETESGPD
jgi:hypothetical protein